MFLLIAYNSGQEFQMKTWKLANLWLYIVYNVYSYMVDSVILFAHHFG